MKSHQTHSKKQSIELDMIKNDISFYHALLSEIISGNISGILIFGLIPYLSLFVIETYNYFSSEMPDYARTLARRHENILRSSRTRIKLFEVHENVDLANWITDFHTDWFINSHKGRLSWLKKLIQPDLGLFTYKDHLICTTHVAFFNSGYEKATLPTSQQEIAEMLSILSKEIGYDIGEYVGNLFNDFVNDNEGTAVCRYEINNRLIRPKDVKSNKYYKSTFNGSGSLHINFYLTLILATTNFLDDIFSYLVVKTPNTFFKLKFITLYHLASSLSNLQNYYYPKGLLTQQSKDFLKEILADKDLRKIRSNSDFRNILVHYHIRNVPEDVLVPDARLFGLIEYFFDGYSVEDFDILLNHQIERASEILKLWSKLGAGQQNRP